MTKKGLKLHISRMHEKSMERIEREKKQRFACNKCDIKRSTDVLLKSHMKLVHGDLKRDLSEMRKRPKRTKAIASPSSLSPPSKKAKKEDTTVEEENSEARIEEDDLEARINDLRIPNTNTQQKKIDDLERLLTASGEVIANLEEENNQLNAKAEFYVELAEDLTIENESLVLQLQQAREEELPNKEANSKKVIFNPVPEQREFEVEEVATGEDERGEEVEVTEKEVQGETGFRQQGGRVTCIVCGLTRNTKSQMIKHMQQQKDEGEIVPAWQVHCALVAY